MLTRLVNIFALTLCVSISYAVGEEFYIAIDKNSIANRSELTNLVSIDNIDDSLVYAYGTANQLNEIARRGLMYRVLPHPGSLIIPKMSADKSTPAEWDSYPTYGAYTGMMAQFESNYPGLCQIVSAGMTVDAREILFAKISDNPSVEEDEPEILLTSSMHGDETTGYVLMLRLIDYLLSRYGTDPVVTRLVDSCEIWINPSANPDGTYRSGDHTVSGARRFNANGVDLNRNFPDPENGPHPDGQAWQPETIAMMNLTAAHSFVLLANFHGGAEVVNYPWDTWSRPHADNDWMVAISRAYADTVHDYSPASYLNDFDNGITNGYAWYEVNGGRQDYSTYFFGGREITVEISAVKLLPGSQLPTLWDYNYRSFLEYSENALLGIRGIVTDASTGDPLAATIRVIEHDISIDSSRVFADPDIGDYHRMISPGVYNLEFSAPSHLTKRIDGIVVTPGSAVRIEAALSPIPISPLLANLQHDAGILRAGYEDSMQVDLTNIGGLAASGVTGVLASLDPYLTIIQNSSSFPNLAALGGSGISNTHYRFSLSPLIPLHHQISLSLEVTGAGGLDTSLAFSITIGQVTEDFESGNLSGLAWQTDLSAPWQIINSSSASGTMSARSANIAHNQSSTLTIPIRVTEAGSISFFRKVLSENGKDKLSFFIDGVEQNSWSGIAHWDEVTFPVAPGSHTIAWRYSKDQSGSAGSDGAWIDDINFPPISSDLAITTASLPEWTAGHPFEHQLLADAAIGETVWSDKLGELAGSGLNLSLSGLISGIPGASVSFTARAADQLDGLDEKSFSVLVNPTLSITTSTLPNGTTDIPYSYQLQSTGGTGTIVWKDSLGTLAGSGLVLSPTGLISGSAPLLGSYPFTARGLDAVGSLATRQLNLTIGYICGDANADHAVNIGDVVLLINHVFKGGPPPLPNPAGDANCDGSTNVGDAVYLVNFIFKSAAPPCCP